MKRAVVSSQTHLYIGCKKRNKAGLGEKTNFLMKGCNHLKLLKKAFNLAFSHACTGPSEEDRKIGSFYYVHDENGNILSSIHVEAEAYEIFSRKLYDLLVCKNGVIRKAWANSEYTKTSNILLTGDVYEALEQGVFPFLETHSNYVLHVHNNKPSVKQIEFIDR